MSRRDCEVVDLSAAFDAARAGLGKALCKIDVGF
jgi:hypothetical protein